MAGTSSEAPPSSTSETPTINNSTKNKSKCSIRSLVANFKAKFCVSKPKPLENSHHNAASRSVITKRNDHHGEDLLPSSEMIPNHLVLVDSALKNYADHMNDQINLAREKFKELQNLGSSERDFEELQKAIAKLKLQIPTQVNILSTTNKHDHYSEAALSPSSKMIRNDLLHLDSAFAEAKEYMDRMSEKINQAHEKFRDLQILRSSPEREFDVMPKKKRDFDELRKAIKKLKVHIPSHVKIRSANSNRHRNQWPNINEANDEITHFLYKEPQNVWTSDFDGLLKDFRYLPWRLRDCLLCFFKFPPAATIKRTTMIYLWIGQRYKSFQDEWDANEDGGNKIFDELVERGFIEPIYQNCSLVPDCCKMSLSVRSALYKEAERLGFTSNDNLDLDLGFVWGHESGHSWLINVGEAIINWAPKIFENEKYIRSLYLGRWQSSTTHHIELADAKILHALKNLKMLKFLSLRGISMITELPTSILKLKHLEILDLRACHNLEAIPDDIGLLYRLTHLDMSECYFLEHMPESLAQLSNLEVLKGFLIGDFNKNKQSCTLLDLSRLPKLRKLKIYISVKDFHRLWDFDDLKNFKVLQKLAISWGGCSLQSQEKASMEQLSRAPLTLPPRLQKLDLQCFPSKGLIDCLRPAIIERLKKLYIRGGLLRDLGQIQKHQGERWNVEILRLKYLSNLKIDWSELRILFPKLIYLHQDDCPKLTNFPCDERGVWMNMDASDSDMRLKKYLKTSGMIGSSSTSGSNPTLAQDDSNICAADEIQLS